MKVLLVVHPAHILIVQNVKIQVIELCVLRVHQIVTSFNCKLTMDVLIIAIMATVIFFFKKK